VGIDKILHFTELPLGYLKHRGEHFTVEDLPTRHSENALGNYLGVFKKQKPRAQNNSIGKKIPLLKLVFSLLDRSRVK